jgi:hypothetical protein
LCHLQQAEDELAGHLVLGQVLGNEAADVNFFVFRLLNWLEIKQLAQLALRYEWCLIAFVYLNIG